MCIIFLDPKCPWSYDADGARDLLQNTLNATPELGRCVDPTSTSPIHCTKLQVRHKGACSWYELCKPCTDFAKDWRYGKVNECEETDKKQAEELKKRESFEMEIVQKEEIIVQKIQNQKSVEMRDRRILTGLAGVA